MLRAFLKVKSIKRWSAFVLYPRARRDREQTNNVFALHLLYFIILAAFFILLFFSGCETAPDTSADVSPVQENADASYLDDIMGFYEITREEAVEAAPEVLIADDEYDIMHLALEAEEIKQAVEAEDDESSYTAAYIEESTGLKLTPDMSGWMFMVIGDTLTVHYSIGNCGVILSIYKDGVVSKQVTVVRESEPYFNESGELTVDKREDSGVFLSVDNDVFKRSDYGMLGKIAASR